MDARMVRPQTLSALLSARAAKFAHSPFLVFENAEGHVSERSYGESEERSARLAAVLGERGVGRGDRVHLHMSNRPEFFDCWFSAARLGAAIVPTNPAYTPPELSYVVEHARCAVSVTQEDLAPAVHRARSGAGTVVVSGSELEREMAGADPIYEDRARGSDVAAVLYTSGTTSRPKGVLVRPQLPPRRRGRGPASRNRR